MKRLFVFMLAVMLVLQPVAARADDPMSLIVQRWIIARILVSGHTGIDEAWFQHSITRAELATWFAAALGRRAEAGAREHEVPFADLKGHWAAGYVAVVAGEGLVNGYADGTFHPDERATVLQLKIMTARLLRVGEPTVANVDELLRQAGVDPALPAMAGEGLHRGQVMVLLDRALSAPLYARYGPVVSIRSGTPLEEAGQRFSRYGLCLEVSCWSEFEVRTDRVTRAELTALLVIFSGRRAQADVRRDEETFADLRGHWANGYVAEAVAQGLVKGYPDGTFRPEEAVTPLELKVMIARLLRLGTPPADQVDAALRSAGIDPALPDLGAPRPLCMGQALVLLDRAMSTPVYARFLTQLPKPTEGDYHLVGIPREISITLLAT